MRPEQPAFPLVAVVLPSQEAFVEYARAGGNAVPPGVIGYYSPRSNRVLLYDATQGTETDALWQQNTVTIIHEATHQMAFNTRIHSRLAVPPRWVGEGLAMLFEAPGFATRNAIDSPRTASTPIAHSVPRVPAGGRSAGTMQRLIQDSDRLFACAGRGLSRGVGSDLLLRDRPSEVPRLPGPHGRTRTLKKYSAAEQLKEFTDVFGTDLQLLESRYLRFISQLKVRTNGRITRFVTIGMLHPLFERDSFRPQRLRNQSANYRGVLGLPLGLPVGHSPVRDDMGFLQYRLANSWKT